MNPTRQRRLWMVGLLLAASVIAGSLIVMALQKNLTYLHSPSDVLTGSINADTRFRLGGVVLEGSVKRVENTLNVDFVVTDRFKNYPVRFDGILPDMFREGTSVIATGRIRDDVFYADEVLAKHDESYMPSEVADAIAKAKQAELDKAGTGEKTP